MSTPQVGQHIKIQPAQQAIVTLPGGYRIPVTILGFDGDSYKVTANLPQWIDKAQVQIIKK